MTDVHTSVVQGEPLTSVEEHLADILATIRPLAPTELSLGDAFVRMNSETSLTLTNGHVITVAVDVGEIADKVRKRQQTD